MATPTLREEQYPLLDAQHHIYLDFTGSNLPPHSLLQAHHLHLTNTLLGNPHSSNPTSQAASSIVDAARANVLSFFHADPHKYSVIFTSNASHALKLVAESYPFRRGVTLALLQDNHNSVHGMRQYANTAGANVHYLPLTDELRATTDLPFRLKACKGRKGGLFVYPAQSNFSGVKHSMRHVAMAQQLGYDVFLDASAYVPTSTLDMRKVTPDFVCVSFYKMFGYPTGIGCLIAKKAKLRRLKRPWFAGGTVKYVSVGADTHLLQDGEGGYEDGTLNFQMAGAVSNGLRYLEAIGMDVVDAHVQKLTGRLLTGMVGLKYENGSRMIRIYGPEDVSRRGGTVNFDMVTREGRVDARWLEEQANARRISLRIGCFCNPGAAERAYRMDRGMGKCLRKLRDAFEMEKFEQCLGAYVGSIRISVGIATVERDVDRFLEFLAQVAKRIQAGQAKIGKHLDQLRRGVDHDLTVCGPALLTRGKVSTLY